MPMVAAMKRALRGITIGFVGDRRFAGMGCAIVETDVVGFAGGPVRAVVSRRR
jgi:hypothetical protein